jgi:hypothetical protein
MKKLESFESQRTPEIKSDELIALINRVKFESSNIYEFNGTVFNIIMFPEDGLDENNVDTWYATSEIVPGCDIYILETLSLEEKKHRLFHEVLELNLRDQGMSQYQAHDLAKAEDQKYKDERK